MAPEMAWWCRLWAVLHLALLLSCGPVCARRKGRLEDLHPTDILAASRPGGGLQDNDLTTPGATQESPSLTEELMERLVAQGADPRKASVRFILELYERLERGEGLPTAASSRVSPDGPAVTATTDTIRGLTPTVSRRFSHRPELSLRFPMSGLTGYRGPELAELRIRPLEQHPAAESDGNSDIGRSALRLARRGSLQRVRVRVLDSEGSRQVTRVYRVKWRRDTADGYTVLDITRILRDMADAGMERFQNGSLEIALQKTRRPSRRSELQQRRPRSTAGLYGTPATPRGENAAGWSAALADDILLVVYAKTSGNFLDDKFQSVPLLARPRPISPRVRHEHSMTELNSTGSAGRRSKRRVIAKVKKHLCSVEDMYVDFNMLGWADDIVFPVRYNAHTCSGKCPSPVSHELHPTNHAILQSMMRMHDRKTRRPCCVPVTLKPLMMLYHRDRDKLQNNGNIEIRTHPDMIVEECGCR